MKKILKVVAIPLLVLATHMAVAQQVSTIGVGDISISARPTKLGSTNEIVDVFDKNINLALLKTRKFTVLKRPELEQRLLTQGLSLQGYYSNKYRDEGIYDQAGLDYILTVDITELSMVSRAHDDAKKMAAVVGVAYRMIGVGDATEDFSASVKIRTEGREKGTSNSLVEQAIIKSVAQLTRHLTTTIFPVRVVKINEDSSVILNYGEGFLAAGDTVFIYPEDADLALDKSGDVIAKSLATLQVVSSDKKFATAKVVQGFESVKTGLAGQLLRSN